MRKNNFVLLAVLFFSLSSHGQDCSGLKDQEVVRLDKNDGPLVNGRIQDQDGVGTCYANATSVALKTALPGNPDLSYLQLAFAHAQVDVLPNNQDKDSAYLYSSAGKSNSFLIDGGFVCKTIEAAKSDKIGGVCKRDDVALEKTLFNPQTNASRDSEFAQSKIITAVSDYYDSVKEKFGITPGAPALKISERFLEFSEFKKAFANLVNTNQERYGKENCLKPDKTNVESVFKNAEARIYAYLKNKYGDANRYTPSMKSLNGKPNPDAQIFFYYMGMGGVYQYGGDHLKVEIAPRFTMGMDKLYMDDLTSSHPSKDALSAFKNVLLAGDKKNAAIADKIMNELSPEDKALLEQDYNRFVKKDVAECLQKKRLDYYKNDDGLVNDFSHDVCLKNYLPQGKSLQSMAQILDRYNLANIDSINDFLTKLPTMNYDQAMRAIVSPDCNDEKKIKIPANLKCDSQDFNYAWDLRQKLVNSGKETWDSIDKKVDVEKEQIVRNADADFTRDVAAIEAKYAGKTDSNSQDNKQIEIKSAERKRDTKKDNALDIAKASVPKKLIGADEGRLWNDYYKEKKTKFSKDALSLLKEQKQVVPITLCTRMFNAPDSTALHDGNCAQDSSDNVYESVGGYHSMAVIGVRCQKGKLNYLIQNSWGDWDSITRAKNPDGSQHFEHEFGKAWMNEDEVMNNSFGYQLISK